MISSNKILSSEKSYLRFQNLISYKNLNSTPTSSEKSKIYEIVDLNKLDDDNNNDNVNNIDIVHQKGANIMCPMDGRKGASYVHSIIFHDDDDGDGDDDNKDEHDEDHYGKATVMLSYTWGYTIGDIVQTLADFCKLFGLDPKRTYVWICFLCVNQHRFIEKKKLGESVPFHTLKDVFGRRVKGIGHLLPMMNPWYDPGYLRRVWCLFEMIIAKKHGCKITMIMPGSDRLDFLKIFDDQNKSALDLMTRLFEVLSNTRVQDAQASEESDRVNIMKIIETSIPGGYATFNMQVNELVRGWAIGILNDELDARRKLVVSESGNGSDSGSDSGSGSSSMNDLVWFLSNVGHVFKQIDEKMDALQIYQECVGICVSIYGKNHSSTADAMNNVACVMDDLGQLEEGLRIHQEVLKIYQSASLFTRNHASIASTMCNMANVMRQLGQMEEALQMHREVLMIRKLLLGKKKHHPLIADTKNNMAIVLNALGQNEEAIQVYKEVLTFRRSLFGKNHSDTADAMNNLAMVMDDLGQKEEALDIYKEVLTIYESLFGKNHASRANTMKNMVSALYDLDRKEEALQLLREALAVLESTLGPDHPSTTATRQIVTIIADEIEK